MLLLLLAVAVLFGVGAVLGAPYLPVLKAEHDNLLDMCELQPGDTLLDLGSGDGRFLRAAAKRGYNAIGYEINPLLYLVSLLITWRHRKQVTIILGNYRRHKLSMYFSSIVIWIDLIKS
jgi:cyclopropane fatty-acyl-phospholipid synthase-like methyltransferase